LTTSIDDLTTPVTRDEAKASIYDALGTVGVNTTAWRPGAVVRTMIAAVAILFSAATRLIAEIAKSGFLELAVGAWLTLVARYVYGVERLAATFATGTLTLTNTGGGVFTVAARDLIVRNPVTDKTYVNVEPFSLGSHGTITIDIVAEEAGSASISAIGTIVEFVTPLINVDCSNRSAAVGADDEEDGPLRVRCREVLGARSSNGPSDAYASVARGAKRPDGTAIGVNRVRIVKDGRGNAYIYLATPTGTVSGDPEDIATDLGIINDQIQRQAAPLGFTAHTLGTTALSLAIGYRVWLLDTSGLTHTQLATLIQTALAKFCGEAPIGGFVIDGQPGRIYLDVLRSVIRGVRPEIFHVELTTHSADIDVGFNYAPTFGSATAVAITEAQQRVI
jgi:hypothetical protein